MFPHIICSLLQLKASDRFLFLFALTVFSICVRRIEENRCNLQSMNPNCFSSCSRILFPCYEFVHIFCFYICAHNVIFFCFLYLFWSFIAMKQCATAQFWMSKFHYCFYKYFPFFLWLMCSYESSSK